jgi:tetratricopeptide (TPR) repeat protein
MSSWLTHRIVHPTAAIGLAVGLAAGAMLLSCHPAGMNPSTEVVAPTPRLLANLGDQKHPVQTISARAQQYFDQGLILTFGFNHEAAIQAFEEASRLDPDCGMCRWGIALALGPNINAPMGPAAAARAYEEVQRALALTSDSTNPRERAYVKALATRYASSQPVDRSALDKAYADAMRDLHRADPSDVDAATLFAEALMDLYPWAYWTAEGEPREFTQEIVATLENVLENAPEHVGANHYYIHAVEEFFPEKGEAAADRLAPLTPDAGHLVHMPSHIYWRIGRYEDAAEINRRASESDERFFAWCRAGAFYRAAYYPHNLHFLWAAASAEGRRDLALMTARKLAATTRPGVAEFPFMQEFIATPMLTMARFGLWDAILGEPRPDDNEIFLVGIWNYTRGLAQVRLGSLEEAHASISALRAVEQNEAAAALPLAGGTASAARLLAIGLAHLEGELAIAEGRNNDAISSLELATELHDSLSYMEPPPWYAPPRQALGALLLEQDRASEAEDVYLEDLRQYPKNGWSLLGLTQSLEAQGDSAKANWAQKGFESAWARADVELTRSQM